VRNAAATAEPRTTKKQLVFPFVKIQGQEQMKLALLLNVIDPNIGGVLIMGDRGTAKSVAVGVQLHDMASSSSRSSACGLQVVQAPAGRAGGALQPSTRTCSSGSTAAHSVACGA
jgi:hypothetical protein